MTVQVQEKIPARAEAPPENGQWEVRAPRHAFGSPPESAPSAPISALDPALAHGVVGCVKETPADLSANPAYMRGYGE
uniref:Uncharacterized protein n=1 Tax=Candidatus Kentrum eta TaxID=2126337 RepID=A0A450V051_9GAMM|nr:MAG: hypothetical protein BECKH772A_GA0070896_1002110 [Candidatus Kentron sp. H]VFJ91598.1 MAG: hypothetical protein BECKH772B_GA0070898_1001910 [Candidatus Kentron sp. H]VFJ98188.1 MAG: hypothetical protein BECKH772C_GA0070978_1001910 [Candidatus Kentron sp. H]